MARPLPQIASFLLALIAAHAGLVGAAPTHDPPPTLAAAISEPPVLEDSPLPPPSAAPAIDWPAEIAGRLAALRDGPPLITAAPPSDLALEHLQRHLAALPHRPEGAAGAALPRSRD